MATITPTKITLNAGVGTFVGNLATYAGGSTHSIAPSGKASKLYIQACNTNASTKTLTLIASDTYCNAGVGNQEILLMQNDEVGIQVEAARFLNADGAIDFTLTSGATGRISCVEVN